MIYLYDESICKDIMSSFNTDENGEPVVRVIAPEGIIQLQAQLKSDVVKFPLISVQRDGWSIDNERINFSRVHKGQLASFDTKTNNLYYEKAIPINIKYTLTVMAESLIDTDEIMRELLFKYFDTYYLSIKLPYESDRVMRFGMRVDINSQVNRSSSQLEYLTSGRINQSSMAIYTEGCVLLSYKESHLRRFSTDKKIHILDENRNPVEDA